MYYKNQNKLDSAILFAKQLNSWVIKNEGDSSLRYAVSYRYIGNCFDPIKNLDSALFYFNFSLDALFNQKRELHQDYARTLNNIGGVYLEIGDNNSAESYYIRSLQIIKNTLGVEHLNYAMSLYNLGVTYSKIGKINSAEEYYNEALKVLDKAVGIEHIVYAKCLNKLGDLHFGTGNYVTAELYYNQVLGIFNKSNGVENVEYAWSLNSLGKMYSLTGELKLAEGQFIKALEVYEQILGLENPTYASTLTCLGVLYAKMDEFKAAENYYQQALLIYQKIFGDQNINYALVLNNLGLLFQDKGDFEKALIYFLQSATIIKKVSDENTHDYAMILNNLGTLYSNKSDFKLAENYYHQAVEIYKKTNGGDNLEHSSVLNNLGILYSDMGDYITSLLYYQKSSEIIKKVLGMYNPDYALILNNLANVYSEIGDYKSADSLGRESIEVVKKTLGDQHLSYASIVTGVGNLKSNIGDYKSAELLYNQALEIRRKVLGENHPDYAWSLNNLGCLNSEKGDFQSAETYLLQSLKIWKKFSLRKTPNYATSLNNLGTLYLKIDDYQTAKKYLKKSLKIRKITLGKEHPDYANCLMNLGILYSNIEDYRIAERYYIQSLRIQSKTLGEGHPNYAVCLMNLGILYSDMGNIKLSESYFKEAYNKKLEHLYKDFLWLSISEKESLWNQENTFSNTLNLFSINSYSEFPTCTELTYNCNLVAKSLLLETSRELDQAIFSSSNQEIKDQLSEMKQLRRIVNKMNSEGSNKKKIIERYIEQADSLDKILVNTLGEYANAKRKFEITWKDVQANLSTSEVAIEFSRYYDEIDTIYKYMALVIRSDYEYPKLVKLGNESKIKSFVKQREFSDLYNVVWSGIDSLLTGVKTIYYSPIGELNNVSFSSLISDNRNTNQMDSFKTNRSYLLDRYDLHQITTTRYLADGTIKKDELIPLSIKLIGGVNYTDLPFLVDSVPSVESNEDFALQINLYQQMSNINVDRGGKINYLKGSEIEVIEIAKTLNNANWETTLSIGKSAGEYQFKEELKEKSPGIIHISTHGFAFPEKETNDKNDFKLNKTISMKVSEDPMVRCGLMFGGANISWSGDSKKMIQITGDDGILTAAEVANLDLSNTKLVVLSACETGLGKIESSEGTFGLKRGFKLAGVDKMIVSLWKVPDNETMELMTLFYSELALTKDIDSSFNKAQKEMRNLYPNEPEKWAGFVLVR